MFDVQFAPHPSEIVRWPWDRCGPWCDASGLQMLEPRDEVFAASEGVRRCARRHIALSVRFGEDSTMMGSFTQRYVKRHGLGSPFRPEVLALLAGRCVPKTVSRAYIGTRVSGLS